MLHKLNKNELIGFYSVLYTKGVEQGGPAEIEPGKLRSCIDPKWINSQGGQHYYANEEGYDMPIH